MTLFLASVRDEAEAETALLARADIIDLKDPAQGALGALDLDTTRRIVSVVAGRVPVSATIGDLPMHRSPIHHTVLQHAACGVDYVKFGLALLVRRAGQNAKGHVIQQDLGRRKRACRSRDVRQYTTARGVVEQRASRAGSCGGALFRGCRPSSGELGHQSDVGHGALSAGGWCRPSSGELGHQSDVGHGGHYNGKGESLFLVPRTVMSHEPPAKSERDRPETYPVYQAVQHVRLEPGGERVLTGVKFHSARHLLSRSAVLHHDLAGRAPARGPAQHPVRRRFLGCAIESRRRTKAQGGGRQRRLLSDAEATQQLDAAAAPLAASVLPANGGHPSAGTLRELVAAAAAF